MAIAFDAASSDSSDNSTSITIAHTCAGSNRILIVFSQQEQVTSCSFTYNGIAMTEFPTISPLLSAAARELRMFYLVAPATGTHDIVGTKGGGSGAWGVQAASYTGVNQSSIPDASSTHIQASGATMTSSVTTVLANCWLLVGARADSGSLAASTGSTLRGSITENAGIFDSNGPVSAGSNSMVQTMTSGDSASIMISLPQLILTATANETVTASDVDAVAHVGIIITINDTVTTSDAKDLDYGYSNNSKSSSTWVNTDKS